MDAVDRPRSLTLPLAFMRVIDSFPKALFKLEQCPLDEIPSSRFAFARKAYFERL